MFHCRDDSRLRKSNCIYIYVYLCVVLTAFSLARTCSPTTTAATFAGFRAGTLVVKPRHAVAGGAAEEVVVEDCHRGKPRVSRALRPGCQARN